MQIQIKVFVQEILSRCQQHTMGCLWQSSRLQTHDSVEYEYYTYLDGVMEKYKPGVYEFDVPEKLRDRYKAKVYGNMQAGTTCRFGLLESIIQRAEIPAVRC